MTVKVFSVGYCIIQDNLLAGGVVVPVIVTKDTQCSKTGFDGQL
jgi:hypothetical protein